MNETKFVMNETKFVTTQPLRQRDKPQFRGNQGKSMTTTTTSRTNRSIVSLNLPKQVPALINLAKGIVQSLTGNATFAASEPPLAALNAALTDLETAEAAALARTRGAVATRNTKRATLITLLEQLKAYVQKVADANVDQGAAMIQSAGLALKKTPVRPRRVFAATPGAVSGSVKLITDAAGKRASYEWQTSIDGGKTWVQAPSTLQAKTTITGLTPAATVTFRYRAVTKKGVGDWSQPLAFIVKSALPACRAHGAGARGARARRHPSATFQRPARTSRASSHSTTAPRVAARRSQVRPWSRPRRAKTTFPCRTASSTT